MDHVVVIVEPPSVPTNTSHVSNVHATFIPSVTSHIPLPSSKFSSRALIELESFCDTVFCDIHWLNAEPSRLIELQQMHVLNMVVGYMGQCEINTLFKCD